MRGQKRSCQKMRRVSPFVYLAYFLVCSLLLTGMSYAQYRSFSSGDDHARVAAGNITVSYNPDDTDLVIDDTDEDFATAIFSFEVSNSNSEVAIEYDIIVTLDNPLPDGVFMTIGDKAGNSESWSGDKTTKSFKFEDAGKFEASPNQSNEHMLAFTVSYDIVRDRYYFQDVTITIDAQQID